MCGLIPVKEHLSYKLDSLYIYILNLASLQKSMLLDCETQIESLLENLFHNYKSLDENSPTGLAEVFGPTKASVAPALAPAVRVYTLLHDILSQDVQTMLRNYLQVSYFC